MMDDIDRLMAVMGSAFDPEYGEAWTRRQVLDSLALPHNSYLLIGSDGHPPEGTEAAVGFALVKTIMSEAEVLLIAVDPRWRRKGIASALLDILINNAENSGVKRVFLEMRANNPAIQLYEAHGFEAIGRRHDYYRGAAGKTFDAITFAKTLL